MKDPGMAVGRIEFGPGFEVLPGRPSPRPLYRTFPGQLKAIPEGAITTKDLDGDPNGWLVPLWHVDSGERIDQVYLTVVLPYRMKGPHLHKVRSGRFICIRGDVEIVTRVNGKYRSEHTGENHNFATVRVEPGVPAEICNYGLEPAYVVNMPTPPWRAEEPDESPVEDWNPKWT